jgi:hypothetical protein
MRCSDRGRRVDDWDAYQAEIRGGFRRAVAKPADLRQQQVSICSRWLAKRSEFSRMPPGPSPRRDNLRLLRQPHSERRRTTICPCSYKRGSWALVGCFSSCFWIEREVEARDGIEPPNKVLQTLPFSFWVPRPVKKFLPSEEEGNRSTGKKRHIFW